MSCRSLCSRNPHKARELERLLPGWTIEPLDRDDYPPETGATYYDNARIKAEFGREHSRRLGARRRTRASRSTRSAAGPASTPRGTRRRARPRLRSSSASSTACDDRDARYVSRARPACARRTRVPRHRHARRPHRRTSRAARRASATTRSSSRPARSARLPSSATSGRPATRTAPALRRLAWGARLGRRNFFTR